MTETSSCSRPGLGLQRRMGFAIAGLLLAACAATDSDKIAELEAKVALLEQSTRKTTKNPDEVPTTSQLGTEAPVLPETTTTEIPTTSSTMAEVQVTSTTLKEPARSGAEEPARTTEDSVLEERFESLIAAFTADGLDKDFRSSCPFLEGVPPSVAKGTDSNDPLEWGLEVGSAEEVGGTYVAIWCQPETHGGSSTTMNLIYVSGYERGLIGRLGRGCCPGEPNPDTVPYSDSLNSTLVGKCYYDECHFFLENDVFGAYFITDEAPSPLLDWLRDDWLSRLKAALTEEQIWLYRQDADLD